MEGFGWKTSTSPWRPILARLRRRFGHLGERFEEKRQARQKPTAPLQTDLAAGNALDVATWTDRNKLECCEERRAPPGKFKSKHLNGERVFGNSDVPKALSDFYSAIFEFPNTVQGQRTSKMVGWFWHARVADTPTFKCDDELLTKGFKKLRKHQHSPDGVTVEIFQQLSPPQLAQLAQPTTDMFTSLDFETVDNSCSNP